MSLSDFHATVRDVLALGDTVDSFLPKAVQHAGLQLERRHEFQYLDRWVSFTVLATDTEPRLIPFPEVVKEFVFFRIVKSDGGFKYLKQINPQQVTKILQQEPSEFWFDGREQIVLGDTIIADTNFEMYYKRLSPWKTMDLEETNWLLDNGEDLLLWQTVVNLGPYLRDPELMATAKVTLDIALDSLLELENRLKTGPTKPIRMGYRGN